MSSTPGYLIDSDVLITAKNRFLTRFVTDGRAH